MIPRSTAAASAANWARRASAVDVLVGADLGSSVSRGLGGWDLEKNEIFGETLASLALTQKGKQKSAKCEKGRRMEGKTARLQ